MKILLDTHIFLWAIADDPRLSKRIKAAYLNEDNELFLSVASFWEILIKHGLGKLPLPQPTVAYLSRQLEINRILLLPIRLGHLSDLERLPPLHRDPFDRMIIAQAIAEAIPIATADSTLEKYKVTLIQ
ncbi:MAG: type II toxin-antitoxin system VapC family toxin [Acidobacteria bacterium]|nr:type II toxin-antitoxin system VapC family toxin [Acidobacteriota bacterium]